jgi:CRP-like cAMP-binding protein
VVPQLKNLNLKPGEVLYQQGDEAKVIYFI